VFPFCFGNVFYFKTVFSECVDSIDKQKKASAICGGFLAFWFILKAIPYFQYDFGDR